MGKETLKDKIKHIVYKITLPIYLWSIGYKTLDEYIKQIEWIHDEEKRLEKEILG